MGISQLCVPEDTGWYHVAPCPTTSFPWSWVLDRQKPSLEHAVSMAKTGKELLIAEVWVSMPLPSGPSVLRPQRGFMWKLALQKPFLEQVCHQHITRILVQGDSPDLFSHLSSVLL